MSRSKNSTRRSKRPNYSKEETPQRRFWNRKIRRQDKDAVREGKEPERHRSTQGWLTW